MVSMFILLPDDLEGIYNLEAGLHAVDLASIFRDMQSEELNVTIPKFKTETSLDLKSNLMEVRTLFQLLQCIRDKHVK
jgi:serine protease inhibitor